MKRQVMGVATFVAIFSVCVCAGSALGDGWTKLDPIADVNKARPMDARDFSCWQAAAANMLAGAGYGNGATVQDRADEIYGQMTDFYTIYRDGYIREGLYWWLHSEHNVWPANPYTHTETYGSPYIRPWEDPDMPQFVANQLRECKFVAVGMWFGGGFGHAMTLWGDEIGSGGPVDVNPSQAWMADSDDHPSDTIVKWDWHYDTDTDPAHPRWRLYSEGGPMVGLACVLSTDPEGIVARSGIKIPNFSGETKDTLSFTAYQNQSWVEILHHEASVNRPANPPTMTPGDWPFSDGKVHSVDVVFDGMNIPDGEWTTAEVQFILSEWNEVRWKDVELSATAGQTSQMLMDHGWWIDSTPQTAELFPGGFVIGVFDILDEMGILVGEERLLHGMNELMDAGHHWFNLRNDAPAGNFYVKNLRFGYSPFNLTSSGMWAYDDWLTVFSDTYTLQAGQTLQWELTWNDLPDPGDWPGLPEPASVSILAVAAIGLLRRRRR